MAALGQTVAAAHWLHFPGRASFRFTEAGPVQAVPDVGVPWPAVVETFQRQALPFILHTRGLEVLHASAVCGPGGVLVLAGRSGVGKSTTAYALHRAGYRLWADDAVVFQAADEIHVHALPFEPRLLPDIRAYFERTAGPPSPYTDTPGSAPDAPLAAAAVLERPAGEDRAPAAERLTPAAAFQALLPHALAFPMRDGARKERMVSQYLDLSARVPVYRVRLPNSLDELPRLVALLAELTAGA